MPLDGQRILLVEDEFSYRPRSQEHYLESSRQRTRYPFHLSYGRRIGSGKSMAAGAGRPEAGSPGSIDQHPPLARDYEFRRRERAAG